MSGRREHGVRSTLQVVCIVALALFLVGILWGEISRTALALRRETATSLTLPHTQRATAYVFRDETLVTSVDGGPVAYAAISGSTVTAGQELALVYADGANTGTRARAAEITAEIERLMAQDAESIPDYYGSYEALMSALSSGNVLGTNEARDTLGDALDRVAAAGETTEARKARIAALWAEFDALIENDRNASDRVNAPHAGVFYREVDGYEALMTAEAVDTLTPGGLRALLASPQSTAQAVGKIVSGGTWYLAVPMTGESAQRFEVGSTYRIGLSRTGEHRTLALSRVTAADTAGEVLLIFSGEGTPLLGDLSRSVEIEITTGATQGIFVPMAAVREENGERFVFVDVDGVAVKRRITPLLIENGYCLAAKDPSPECLQEGESMVVTKRHIYEGKPL